MAVLSGAAQLGAVVNYSIAGKLKLPVRTFKSFMAHIHERILDKGLPHNISLKRSAYQAL
jgi:hypothetical protein